MALLARDFRHKDLWTDMLGIKVVRGMVIRDMEVIMAISLQILGIPIYYQREFVYACKKDKGTSGYRSLVHDDRAAYHHIRVLVVLCASLCTNGAPAGHQVLLLDRSKAKALSKPPPDLDKTCKAASPSAPRRRTVCAPYTCALLRLVM